MRQRAEIIDCAVVLSRGPTRPHQDTRDAPSRLCLGGIATSAAQTSDVLTSAVFRDTPWICRLLNWSEEVEQEKFSNSAAQESSVRIHSPLEEYSQSIEGNRFCRTDPRQQIPTPAEFPNHCL